MRGCRKCKSGSYSPPESSILTACRKKLLLSLSVRASRQRGRLPDCSRVKRPASGWEASCLVFLALALTLLLYVYSRVGRGNLMGRSAERTTSLSAVYAIHSRQDAWKIKNKNLGSDGAVFQTGLKSLRRAVLKVVLETLFSILQIFYMLLLVFGPLKITNCLEQGNITLLKVWQNRGGTFGPDLDPLNILCSKMPSHKKVKKLDNSQVKQTFHDKFWYLCPTTRHNKTGKVKFRFCNTSKLLRFIKKDRKSVV